MNTTAKSITEIAALLDNTDIQPVKAKLAAAGFSSREIEKTRDAITLALYAFQLTTFEGVNKHATQNVSTALMILTGIVPEQSVTSDELTCSCGEPLSAGVARELNGLCWDCFEHQSRDCVD